MRAHLCLCFLGTGPSAPEERLRREANCLGLGKGAWGQTVYLSVLSLHFCWVFTHGLFEIHSNTERSRGCVT